MISKIKKLRDYNNRQLVTFFFQKVFKTSIECILCFRIKIDYDSICKELVEKKKIDPIKLTFQDFSKSEKNEFDHNKLKIFKSRLS